MKPKDQTNDWVYIIDNSARMDNRKVCLILGSRLSKLKKGKYLTFEDLEVIEIRVITKNNEIEMIIENAIEKTGIPIQICSDKGSDIMPSIRKIISRNPEIKHVPDIMHLTGNMLKKKLGNDKRWKKFITLLNKAKKRLCMSKLSFMCPPDIRGKSRFLNCQNVIEWAIRVLVLLEEIDKNDPHWEEMKAKLGWLVGYKQDIALFRELFKLAALAKEVVRKLHVGKGIWQAAEELLREEVLSSEGALFAKEIVDFLKTQCEKTPEGKLFIGSSEIIESAFSKLKLLDRECGNSGFTSSILGVAACFGPRDYQSIEKAFQECNQKDVSLWKEKHIGETIQTRRRKFLKSQKKEDFGLKLARFIEVNSMAA